MAGERILVADDERDVLDVAVRALSLEGYQVTGVSSGLAAVEEAQQQHYDLLIADVKMPGISGLRAYRLIKSFSPDTIGLIITGFGTLEMAIEALRLGVNAFILKPFGPDELKAAVARALEARRLARENARLRALLPVHELTRALVATTDLDSLVSQVVELAARETSASRCSLFLLDEPRQELRLAATYGEAAHSRPGIALRADQGIAGWVARSGEPLSVYGALSSDASLARFTEHPGGSSAVLLPLLTKGRTIGVLEILKDAGSPPFTDADTELLSILAAGAAVAIENARLFTDLQRAYERLADLDHRKSEFISLAAHELRSPLASVITYASLIEDGADEATRAHVRVILDSAARLQRLLDDMLNLRSLDTGAATLRPEPVAIAEAVDDALRDLSHLARAKRHTIETRLPPELPRAFADREKLRIILLNLISNAIKFTPDGGTITIEGATQDEELVVSVRDTGIGIPQEEQERIFERFYQVADSLRREQAGLGLGLSIVRGMVELHGGRIWVESRVGEGSTFTFTLPEWHPPVPAHA
ncbi:MAG: response regulator [Anaerolineae bacterium]|nr:response regulator [Anaerolineae bacterium]